MVLAAPDRDTAQWSADSLGRSEVEEVAEGYSYGANTIRDGVSLTPRRELRALALPSEIMRLPNLHGYLKFPGPLPVASIRLKHVNRPASAERFEPRAAGTVEADASSDASAEAAPASEVSPEEPEGWFGQGELDLFGESDGAREGAVESGAPPASGADAVRHVEDGFAIAAARGWRRPTRRTPGPPRAVTGLAPRLPRTSRRRTGRALRRRRTHPRRARMRRSPAA